MARKNRNPRVPADLVLSDIMADRETRQRVFRAARRRQHAVAL